MADEEKPYLEEEEPYIVEEEPYIVEEEPYPDEEEPYLVEEEPYLVEEEPYPDEEEPYLVEEEPYLVEEEPSPDEEEPYPDEEEPYYYEEENYFDEEDCYHGQGVLWRREECIGRGSFATVFLATSVFGANLPPQMAVKSTIRGEVYIQEKKVLETLAAGDCPFIIKYLGSDQSRSNDNTRPSLDLFFEYAAGGTLRTVLNAQSGGGGLPEMDVRRYTRDVLRGLAHVHSRGYVHCDIKPDNILLVAAASGSGSGSDYVAKVGDFGLAKPVNYMCPPEERGTLDYAPPESDEYEKLETSSDIWSVGCIVRELLTGSVDEDKKSKRRLSRKATEFIKACMNVKPECRWTAEMLLKHPFVENEMAAEKKKKKRELKEEDESEIMIRKRRKVEKFVEASMELMAEDMSTAKKLLREALVEGLGEIQREMQIKDRRRKRINTDMMLSQFITNIM